MNSKIIAIAVVAVAAAVGLAAVMAVAPNNSTSESQGTITIYSGRAESLVGPIIQKFEQETGIKAQVRYGNTAAMALAIMEEGRNSPADLFFAQDAGALGALSKEGRLLKISEPLLDKVDPKFRSSDDEWIGITGRARVVDYNIKLVDKSELPDSIWGFLDPKWKGKIGWSPPNGSFQAFVTAMRIIEGEDRAKQWVQGIMANEPISYSGNTPLVEAIGRGEVHVGFVNNYYLHQFQARDPSFPVAHHYTKDDAGSMINIAGLAIVDTTKNKALAERFIEYMLSEDAQLYFATQTYEYPLVGGMRALGPQLALEEINTPNLDLSNLDDLEGTLKLLREVGAL